MRNRAARRLKKHIATLLSQIPGGISAVQSIVADENICTTLATICDRCSNSHSFKGVNAPPPVSSLTCGGAAEAGICCISASRVLNLVSSVLQELLNLESGQAWIHIKNESRNPGNQWCSG